MNVLPEVNIAAQVTMVTLVRQVTTETLSLTWQLYFCCVIALFNVQCVQQGYVGDCHFM